VLQFRNSTPFVGTIALLPDAQGIDTLYMIVKATFTVRRSAAGTSVELAQQQIPVTVAPEYYGEPGLSSIKRPSDISLEKPGTDVVIMGHAWAPNGRAVQVMDVGVRVGSIQKIARVFGDRVWTYSGVGFQSTAPEPFEMMPIVWERAYGGTDLSKQGPIQDGRNPVGTGFRVSEGGLPVEGVRLPNIEDPRNLITSWNQQPAPVGFAPIDAYWEPRRSYAGTYDEQWQKQRAPYLPDDFDPRFLQVAPVDMIAPRVEAGEWVDVRGMTPQGVLQFQLPAARPRIVYEIEGSVVERPALLDTIIIEPDDSQFQLVWRAALKCDKKALKVNQVEASLYTTA
jgi:hypothetical protein